MICLHYAGGNGYFYYKWKKFLPEINVVALNLPGHGSRINEPLEYSFRNVVAFLYSEIVKNTEDNQPYMIFGHSMGGLLIYFVLHLLEKNNACMPIGVIISGASLPNEKDDRKRVDEMNEEEFIEMVMESGGMNQELLDLEEFKNCFLPIIKADYTVLDNKISLERNQKFDIKAAIFNGFQDENAIEGEEQWKGYFHNEVDVYHFEGGHFYFESKTQKVCECIRDFVRKVDENIYEEHVRFGTAK